MTHTFDQCLDTSGLTCPEPVMLLHKTMRELEPGQVVKVIATDPSTERDIPKFCQFLGHELLTEGPQATAAEGQTEFCYLIRKKQD